MLSPDTNPLTNPEKTGRQKNQHPIRENEWDISPRSEELLGLIKRYQYRHNVTNYQYACLLGITLRSTIRRLNELIQKNRVDVYPPGRKRGRGKANQYVLKDFDPSLMDSPECSE